MSGQNATDVIWSVTSSICHRRKEECEPCHPGRWTCAAPLAAGRAMHDKSRVSMPMIDRIAAAEHLIRPHVRETLVERSDALAAPAGAAAVWFKCEHLQHTGSFKPRGALNKYGRVRFHMPALAPVVTLHAVQGRRPGATRETRGKLPRITTSRRVARCGCSCPLDRAGERPRRSSSRRRARSRCASRERGSGSCRSPAW